MRTNLKSNTLNLFCNSMTNYFKASVGASDAFTSVSAVQTNFFTRSLIPLEMTLHSRKTFIIFIPLYHQTINIRLTQNFLVFRCFSQNIVLCIKIRLTFHKIITSWLMTLHPYCVYMQDVRILPLVKIWLGI